MIKYLTILAIVILLISRQIVIWKKRENSSYKLPKKILRDYKKITIPVERVSVLSRKYFDEDTKIFSKIDMLDSIANSGPKKMSEKNVSVLIYEELFYRGKKIKVKSDPIYLPEVVLKMKLKKQKAIILYYDEMNPHIAYFDLSFLATKFI